MKNINEYITEMLAESIFNELMNAICGFLDHMYQEGVVAYNDEAMEKLVKRKQKPDYIDICNGVLNECPELSNKAKNELKSYLKSGKGLTVEDVINASVDKFCSSL